MFTIILDTMRYLHIKSVTKELGNISGFVQCELYNAGIRIGNIALSISDISIIFYHLKAASYTNIAKDNLHNLEEIEREIVFNASPGYSMKLTIPTTDCNNQIIVISFKYRNTEICTIKANDDIITSLMYSILDIVDEIDPSHKTSLYIDNEGFKKYFGDEKLYTWDRCNIRLKFNYDKQ